MSKKKILVTGAFGFIGSNLVEYLVENNYQVLAFDRYNSDSSYGYLENSKYFNDIEFILGDIRDYDSVNKALKNCSICIHLAALIGIPYSYISPIAYLKTNLEGTYNVLESIKNLNTEQVIITSTSEVYGTAQSIPIDEKHRLNAQSPYAASKISADHLGLSYYNSFDIPLKIIRPFNTYGPRQSARAIIPTIILQCLNADNELKLGNLHVQRDFTYVLDLCDAYLKAIKCNELYGEIFNVGSNQMINLNRLIEIIFSKINIRKKILSDNARIRKKESEVERLQADNSKFVKFTEWSPKISLDEGIEKTIKWIKENHHRFNKNIYYV
ncbi:MAG: NAD-dependent dehydratase [Parcubacteria group bacterium]|nr:NAD-dependent dehydratase [Parcubacteria group bacterium]